MNPKVREEINKLLSTIPVDTKITVRTTQGQVTFVGRYRADLETQNWHYWEKTGGYVIHFHKDHLIYVEGGRVEDIETCKKIKYLRENGILYFNNESSFK